jgi:hypothetical protein
MPHQQREPPLDDHERTRACEGDAEAKAEAVEETVELEDGVVVVAHTVVETVDDAEAEADAVTDADSVLEEDGNPLLVG